MMSPLINEFSAPVRIALSITLSSENAERTFWDARCHRVGVNRYNSDGSAF